MGTDREETVKLYLDAALFYKLLKFINEEAKRKRDRKQGHDM